MFDRVLNKTLETHNIVLAKIRNSKFKMLAMTNTEWKYDLRDAKGRVKHL